MAHSALHGDFEYVLARIIQEFMLFLHQSGLSGPQIHTLLHIYHAGECRISDIGALMGASPAAASQLVDRLTQQGLVERAEDPLNRRIKRLHLTDEGLRLIRQGVTSNHFLTSLMAALPEEQRQAIHTAFGYLAQASHQAQASHEQKVEHHA